ncbi:MAG: pilus assembly PilX N-terminal domain-containing protein [Candidatus Omnitrophica bacterium]|nr:pilus assembly PilX N-terminal domain-containing protein [Candidatus Omnitrophota bacterium]
MRNKKGSVLTVTLSLVIIFLMLGLATIHYASVQNETAERRLSSMEAFWLADAGVELARSKLNKSSPTLISQADPPETLGEGEYDVYSEQDPDCPTCINRWHINSQGSVDIHDVDGTLNTQPRGIDAIAAYVDVKNAITTHGTVNGSCAQGGNATITGDCDDGANFSFVSVLGATFGDLVALAQLNLLDNTHPAYDASSSPPVVDHVFHLDSPSDLFEVVGVTVVFLEGNLNKFTVNTDDLQEYAGPTLLIVDGTGSPPNKAAEITINGVAGLCGVIWSIGEATINGNSTIDGAVFIDGDPLVDNDVLGNTNITFDTVCVDQALGGFGTGTPRLVSWKEYAL